MIAAMTRVWAVACILVEIFPACLCQAQDYIFSAGTNTIHLVFADAEASGESKELFLSDFKAACAATENGLSVKTRVDYCTNPPYAYPVGWVTNNWLYGKNTPMFSRAEASFPATLVRTNGVWLLSVGKEYTDGYEKVREFAAAHSAELEKLRKFLAEDLAADRLASLSDEGVYEMFLDKQWIPGDGTGPSGLDPEDRPPPIRGPFFPLQVRGMLFEPVGPADSAEHLWAFLKGTYQGDVVDVPAIYWHGKWWLSLWMFEGDLEPAWSPTDVQ